MEAAVVGRRATVLEPGGSDVGSSDMTKQQQW